MKRRFQIGLVAAAALLSVVTGVGPASAHNYTVHNWSTCFIEQYNGTRPVGGHVHYMHYKTPMPPSWGCY